MRMGINCAVCLQKKPKNSIINIDYDRVCLDCLVSVRTEIVFKEVKRFR